MRGARASEWPHGPVGRPIREASGLELLDVGDLVYRGVIAVSRAAFRGLGLRIELRGDEHLPTTGGAVLASNHVSFLDFLFVGLVGVQRGRLVRFLAKESIFRLPVVGWAMRRMRHISVDRAHGTAALRRAVRVAAAGEVVGIFPEATFSRNGALLPLRPGAAAIAVWDQVRLVGVAVWGGQNVLCVRHWRFRLRRGVTVTVVVGEPLRPGPHADPVAVTDVLRARVGDLVRETAQTLAPEPSRAR